MEYSEIPLFEFLENRDVPFEIYIRLTENKFLKIANRSSDLNREQLLGYQDKGVSGLFLSREDFAKFININLPTSEQPANREELKKFAQLEKESETAIELIFENEMNEITFEMSKLVVRDMLGFTAGIRNGMNILFGLRATAKDDAIYKHSVSTSMYSVMIALRLKWVSSEKLYKVGLGALLHDIGSKQIHPAILAKRPQDMNPTDLAEWQKHPRYGVAILQQLNSMPDEVLQIVLQHHENGLGEGFPQGLRKSRIHPMAKVVSLADRFCELALGDYKELLPIEVVQKLSKTGQFDLLALEGLASLFT